MYVRSCKHMMKRQEPEEQSFTQLPAKGTSSFVLAVLNVQSCRASGPESRYRSIEAVRCHGEREAVITKLKFRAIPGNLNVQGQFSATT